MTLYFSHLTSLFNEISLNKIKYDSLKNNSSSKILITKYILHFNKSINLLMEFNNIHRLPKYSKDYYLKIIEFVYTILNCSFNSKLYSETILFQESKISKKTLSYSLSIIITDIYHIIFNILDKLSKNKDYIDIYQLNSNYFDKKLILKTNLLFGEFIYSNSKKTKLSYLLNNILEKIEKNKTHNNVVKFKKDLPDRFIDSILYTCINNPIEIPDALEIVDKYTIINQLSFSETNPFTNTPLTKQQLYNYNDNNEVKERLCMYNEDLVSWKIENKIE